MGKWVVLFLLLFVTTAYAFSIDDITVDKKIPYRMNFGDTGKYVDVKDCYNEYGFLLFSDDSSIMQIIYDPSINEIWVIKEKSTWRMNNWFTPKYGAPNPKVTFETPRVRKILYERI